MKDNNKQLKQSDIDHYVFCLESVFTDHDMSTRFQQFLRNEHNLESYEFLSEVFKLRALQNEQEQVKAAIRIMETFVECGSMKGVNLCSSEVNNLVTLFEKSKQKSDLKTWRLTISHKKLFSNAAYSILTQLQRDSFVRFVRSSSWLKFVMKKGMPYLQKVAILKVAHKMCYTNDDFVDHIVTDKDLDLFKELDKDSFEWKLIGSKFLSRDEGSINAFVMKRNYFPNVSMYDRAVLVKWYGILNFPFDHVKKVLLPIKLVPQYDRNIAGYDVYKYMSHEELRKQFPNINMREERSCAITRFEITLPWPFKHPRYTSWCSTASFEPDTHTICLVHKPCKNENAANKIPNAFDILDFQYYALTKIDESRTLFNQIHICDVQGYAQKAAKLVIMDRAVNLRKELVKTLANAKDVQVEKDDVFGKLVDDVINFHERKIINSEK